MDNKIEERAREILRRPYTRTLILQDDGGFTAEILEFPGCFAEGGTAEEANTNLEAAAESWIIGCFDSGKAVPDPLAEYEGSGKFALRLPRSLYGRAAKAAARDGVSLNQFITHAVAEKLGASTVPHRVDHSWEHSVFWSFSVQTVYLDEASWLTGQTFKVGHGPASSDIILVPSYRDPRPTGASH